MADHQIQSPEQRLQDAMAAEYAAGWPEYNVETRSRMGAEQAQLTIRAVLAAIRRAGLKLVEVGDA